ncbi:MAG TPA: biotin--[acetyl-CoA-carboxylase] ligase [Glaciibacter sp.]|nr:biotin--[acetyl-CoA-carboxylase] ligase [Glaciibacter sp.]
MEFPQSREVARRFEYLDETGSTNDVLVANAAGADAAGWPDFSVVVTDNQTRGRGRLGRIWMAPSGKSLAISVLLRPGGVPIERFGWFPLLAGAAMTRAVRDVVEASTVPPVDVKEAESPSHAVSLKWPNDVLIDGYKVSGILSELLPDARGVIVGAGLNVSLDEHDLPTMTSTSLMLVTSSSPDPDAVLCGYLRALADLYSAFVDAGGDPEASGLLAEVLDVCGTIGSEVRVELPGGDELLGTAEGIDEHGRLRVRDHDTGDLRSVAAGDVTHLRY